MNGKDALATLAGIAAGLAAIAAILASAAIGIFFGAGWGFFAASLPAAAGAAVLCWRISAAKRSIMAAKEAAE